MRREFEYAVVGLGGIGSAAAYWLARRAGTGVLGLERFFLGHGAGASQDHSRIIRLSYHTPNYVAWAHEAYETWARVEEDVGERLVVKTGGLDLFPPGSAIALDDYRGSLRSCRVDFEILEASAIMRRWPQFRLPAEVVGLFQRDGGIAAASRCTQAHIRGARERGATLLEHAPATSIRSRNGEFDVVTEEAVFRCGKVLIACDAWTNEVLAHLGRQLPLTVTQEQVNYFAPPRVVDFSAERFPVWIWMDEPSFYGVPAFEGHGVKVGQDVGGREVTPRSRSFETDRAARERVERFLAEHLPDACGPVTTKSCLYTMPPDRDFVVDEVPGQPGAFVALGAAHGFKFASLIGKVLSDLAVDSRTRLDVGPFRIDRPLLTMADPPRRFLM
jgi:sarcosine oxidase